GVDARAGQSFEGVAGIIDSLKERGTPVEVLFMDCNDQTLIKRYKETRRIHPMNAVGDRLEDGIAKEREVLSEIKKKADYVIDTSSLLTRELKEELDRIFVKNEGYNSLMINVLSFGFKHGIPSDADLVFDVRFLPNPYYIDELKHKTGNDKPVQDYVKSFPACQEFVDKLTDMLEFLIPGYVKEGKYQLVVAIGCTGGQHRSVTIANELYERLKNLGGNFGLKLTHRDVKDAK
ncbi:MAG: RNase adapter RapZ, partial [Butyrivibrio sp.]|nr:RNase adapter RapZ [Butyrivibrio sp.]